MSNHVRRLVMAVTGAALLLSAGCSTVRGSVASDVSMPLRVAPLDLTGSETRMTRVADAASSGSLPDALPVYRVKRPTVDARSVSKLAASLGLEGQAHETPVDIRVTGPSGKLLVDRSTGSFDYTTSEFEQLHEPLEHLLSDQEYRRRAEEFLRSAGLMHPMAEFRDVNRGNVVGKPGSAHTIIERPYMIEVRFSHKPLDGIAFDKGVGPKIVVQFGESGRIAGAMSVWRDVTKAGTYRLVGRAAALRQISTGEALVYADEPSSEGTATAIELSYVNDPLGYAQENVIPYYIVRGTSGPGRSFTAMTRAIPKESLVEDPAIAGGMSD